MVFKNKNSRNHIYRCKNCQVLFEARQLESSELSAYYNGMYNDLPVAFSVINMNWGINSMKTYVKNVSRKIGDVQGRTFLDFWGDFDYYSKAVFEFGFNPLLVEKDPVSVSFRKNELEITNIIYQDLEEFFRRNNKKYDVFLGML